jgi:PAS domain S-box-containing protein
MVWRDIEVKLTPSIIVLIYLLVGTIWAMFSDWVPSVIFSDPALLAMLEIINHWVFIAATAALLFFLIRRSEAVIVRRKESLYRLNRALKTFSECNQALIRARDEPQLMREVCRTIVEVGGYRLAWVGVAENDGGKTIRPVAQWGDESGYLEKLQVSWANNDRGRGPTGTAIRTGQTSVVQNIRYDPKWQLWREEALRQGFAASISLPLSDGERPFGALVIFAGEYGAFDKEEVKLLEELTSDLSYGITMLRMNAERKKGEKERRLLASVIEQAMEGIILFDSEGLVQYANPAVKTITGRTPAEMIGRNTTTLESEGLNNEFYRVIWDALSRGEARTGHFIQKGKDGALHEIDSTIWSIADDTATVSNYAALIRDVTNEVHLERQLRQAQRMEAIATLAGGIAHDFNNNLASIITCAEMARDDLPKESPTRELLDVVLKAGFRGRNLVRQILTFSCQGEQERHPVQVDLIVHECLRLLRASLPASIEIHCRIADRLGLVPADPTQIHQIVMNLCTNAGHAMREKGGMLEISLVDADLDSAAVGGYPDLPPGRYLKMTVRDTGHGIDRQTMERIFDPFFTTKGHAEGTGLGLSVIHGIVRNYGGVITVESEPGNGATFNVFLPRIDGPGERALDEVPVPAMRGRERILLVDDETDLAKAGGKMLERLGYEVVVSTNGREALDLFRTGPGRFDLVITDQAMPGMTGLELARELTGIRANLPVILCTGFGHAPNGAFTNAEREAAGIRELALKPLDRAEMSGIIRRVLDGNRSAEGATWQRS